MAMRFSGEPVAAIGARLWHLVIRPGDEWTLIRAEPMTIRSLYLGWIMPLAAIGPVAGMIGLLVFGRSFFGAVFRPPIEDAVAEAVIAYALMLIGTQALALIADAVAPRFGAARNPVAALKAVAFSMGPFWLAGIFRIVPALAEAMPILGLYGAGLLWLGLPRLMKGPANKAPTYIVLMVVAAVVTLLLIDVATGALSRTFIRPPLISGSAEVRLVLPVPGGAGLA